MDTLEFDYDTLTEDYEAVVALEALGVGPDHPLMAAYRKRWVIDDAELRHVAHEAMVTDAIVTAKNVSFDLAAAGVKALAKGTGVVSMALLKRFKTWAVERERSFFKFLDERTSKATELLEQIEKLAPKVKLVTKNKEDDVGTDSWTAKLCVEDKLDLDACIAFSSNRGKLDSIAKSFVTYATTSLNDVRVRDTPSATLRKIGKSSGWAIKRAALTTGLYGHKYSTEAWALPGNVAVVMVVLPIIAERIGFGVARDGEYGRTVPRLDQGQCDAALKAAHQLAETVRDKKVKRGMFSYSGVFDELEEQYKAAGESMVGQTASNLATLGKTLVTDGAKAAAKFTGNNVKAAARHIVYDSATKRYKNALTVEEAIITAQVRVCEGLIEYVKRSVY